MPKSVSKTSVNHFPAKVSVEVERRKLPVECETVAADVRSAPRFSIYLAAMLETGATSVPVKIRNMSTSGVLVEGDALPAAGGLVRLVRGGLAARGAIVWSADRRCAVKFSGPVDVQIWRTTPTNVDQRRVDELVCLVKSGAVPRSVAMPSSSPHAAIPTNKGAQLAEDLCGVSSLLRSLEDVLSSESDFVRRYGAQLQNLDIAMQTLGAIASLCRGDMDPAIAIRLDGLRSSATQALKSSL